MLHRTALTYPGRGTEFPPRVEAGGVHALRLTPIARMTAQSRVSEAKTAARTGSLLTAMRELKRCEEISFAIECVGPCPPSAIRCAHARAPSRAVTCAAARTARGAAAAQEAPVGAQRYARDDRCAQPPIYRDGMMVRRPAHDAAHACVCPSDAEFDAMIEKSLAAHAAATRAAKAGK